MGDSVRPVRVLYVPSTRGTTEFHLSSIIYCGGNHFTARIFEHGCTYMYDGQKFLGDCIREEGKDLATLPEGDLREFVTLGGRSAYLFVYVQH